MQLTEVVCIETMHHHFLILFLTLFRIVFVILLSLNIAIKMLPAFIYSNVSVQ